MNHTARAILDLKVANRLVDSVKKLADAYDVDMSALSEVRRIPHDPMLYAIQQRDVLCGIIEAVADKAHKEVSPEATRTSTPPPSRRHRVATDSAENAPDQ